MTVARAAVVEDYLRVDLAAGERYPGGGHSQTNATGPSGGRQHPLVLVPVTTAASTATVMHYRSCRRLGLVIEAGRVGRFGAVGELHTDAEQLGRQLSLAPTGTMASRAEHHRIKKIVFLLPGGRHGQPVRATVSAPQRPPAAGRSGV